MNVGALIGLGLVVAGALIFSVAKYRMSKEDFEDMGEEAFE